MRRPRGLSSWSVVDGLWNAIERAKRAQQSLHYYRKWNYIMQENLVVTWPSVRPYVSPPLDVDGSTNEISHWRTHAYGLLEGKKKATTETKPSLFVPQVPPSAPGWAPRPLMLNDICSSFQSFVAIALEPKTSYNIVGSCCVRLHVAKSLTGFKLSATTELPTTCNRLCKRTQHLTSNSVGSCWPTMLRGFRHTSSFEKSYFKKKSFIRLAALIIEHISILPV